jgi:hypothetical protein
VARNLRLIKLKGVTKEKGKEFHFWAEFFDFWVGFLIFEKDVTNFLHCDLRHVKLIKDRVS